MTDRKLTEQERKLWQLYTRNIKVIGPQDQKHKPDPDQKALEIKIPKTVKLKRPAPAQFSNHESLKDRDSNWGKKLKQGKVAIDGKIDLHGMTCAQAFQKLHDFLARAQANGKRVILVITGKGGPKRDLDQYKFREYENNHGILKREVPIWLSGGSLRHMIVSFQDARNRDGGAGALYVVLKRKK